MPTRHEELFEEYLKEMRDAQALAEAWWKDLVKKAGAAEARRRWPLGPAAHPRVIHLLRKYWFKVEDINRDIEAGKGKKGEDVVYPQHLLADGLLDGKNDDLAQWLNTLTYWPLGLDENDDYV
jgi:hypothetical protein